MRNRTSNKSFYTSIPCMIIQGIIIFNLLIFLIMLFSAIGYTAAGGDGYTKEEKMSSLDSDYERGDYVSLLESLYLHDCHLEDGPEVFKKYWDVALGNDAYWKWEAYAAGSENTDFSEKERAEFAQKAEESKAELMEILKNCQDSNSRRLLEKMAAKTE